MENTSDSFMPRPLLFCLKSERSVCYSVPDNIMPKNKDSQYRDYDDDDIDRIWTIRILQGMGYTIKEIVNMVRDEEYDFDDSIAKKVSQLEAEKKKLERHLGYARAIKLTGRFPSRPKEMGKVRCEDFQNNAIEKWNILNDPQEEFYANLAETMLDKPPEEWENSDLGRMFSVIEKIKNIDIDVLLVEYVLPKAICKRKELGAGHPDIQFMVKLIYENQNALGIAYDMNEKMTIRQFARFYSSSYLAGDVARLKANDYSKDDCEFIAEAVSVFGGYKSHDELVETELRYGRPD